MKIQSFVYIITDPDDDALGEAVATYLWQRYGGHLIVCPKEAVGDGPIGFVSGYNHRVLLLLREYVTIAAHYTVAIPHKEHGLSRWHALAEPGDFDVVVANDEYTIDNVVAGLASIPALAALMAPHAPPPAENAP